MIFHRFISAFSGLLIQSALAAPASLGDGDEMGMQGHGQEHGQEHGHWKSPPIFGGSSDFNTGPGAGMGSGGFDNSHCNNNQGGNQMVTTTITTCPAASATKTSTVTVTTNGGGNGGTTTVIETISSCTSTTTDYETVTADGITTTTTVSVPTTTTSTVTTGAATVTVPASTTTVTSTQTTTSIGTTTVTHNQIETTTVTTTNTFTLEFTTTVTADNCAATDPGTPSYGSCSDPTIRYEYGLDGRTEYAYTTNNQADFPFGSSPNIDPDTALICNRLRSPCNAPEETVQRCLESAEIVSQLSGQEAADVWNQLMT